MIPDFLFPPNERTTQRTKKMGLTCAVLGLHPEPLPFAMDDIVINALEVFAERRGEMVFVYRFRRVFPRDQLCEAGCGLGFWFDRQGFSKFGQRHLIISFRNKSA